MGLVLGIETSCDETAAAVVDDQLAIRSSVVESSLEVHKDFGGVVPELAGRAHVATIGPVVRRALEEAGLDPLARRQVLARGADAARGVGHLAGRRQEADRADTHDVEHPRHLVFHHFGQRTDDQQ